MSWAASWSRPPNAPRTTSADAGRSSRRSWRSTPWPTFTTSTSATYCSLPDGSAQLPEVVELSDRRADSPMETRIRLALRSAGLPLPHLQHAVGPYLLDLAYPAVHIAVEYNGHHHLDPDRALHDLEREAYLTAAGWTVLRFGAYLVRRRPDLVAARVRVRLVDAARAAALPLEALAAA